MPEPMNVEPNKGNQHSSFDEERIWQLLSSSIDGELTPEEQDELARLLSKNPQWHRELALLRATSQILRQEAEVEPPLHLRQAILASTVNRRTWRHIPVRLLNNKKLTISLTLSGGALAVAGVLLVAFLKFHAVPMEKPVFSAPVRVAVVPHPSTVLRPFSAQASAQQHRRPVTTPTMRHAAEMMLARVMAPLRTDFVPSTVMSKHFASTTVVASSSKAMVALSNGGAPKRIVASPKHVHVTPSNLTNRSTNEVQMASAIFSPVPGMDQINQPVFSHSSDETPALMSNTGVSSKAASSTTQPSQVATVASKPVGSGDTSNNSSSGAATPTLQPATDKKPVGDQGDTPLAYMAYLPPEALKFRSTASIKRELTERNLGLNRIAIENTEQRQARIVLISGSF